MVRFTEETQSPDIDIGCNRGSSGNVVAPAPYVRIVQEVGILGSALPVPVLK